MQQTTTTPTAVTAEATTRRIEDEATTYTCDLCGAAIATHGAACE